MSDSNSPWGSSGGSSGGSGGNSNGGGNRGNSPWGSGGKKPPNRGGANRPQQTELDNVIRGFKSTFGGGGNGPVKRGGGKPGIGMPLVIAGVGLLMLAMSCVYTVDQQEQAVVLRFGEYQQTTLPGLHFKLPTPIETIRKVDMDTKRTITFGGGAQQNLMLTGDENIARVDYAVIWVVKDAADYVFNVENVPGAVSDVAESAMREVVGKTELETFITSGRDTAGSQVQVLMQDMLDEYKSGVAVDKVELTTAEAPADVLKAFLDVVSAKQEAEQSILAGRKLENELIPRANAEADRLIQEANGYKEAVIAESRGDADRFRAIHKEYKAAPRVTRQRMYLETMEDVYAGADKIILDEGAGSGVVPYLPLDQLVKKGAK